MMTDRRKFGLALAALSAVPAACARREGPLVVWAMGVEGEALGGMASRFLGSDIRVQALPWAAAHEKLLTAFAADDLPDIIALGNTWVPEFDALGALEPLDGMLRMSNLDLGHMFSAARQSVTLNGRVVGIPWYVDTRLLFYRKDLLNAAGFDTPAETWDGWDRQLEALSGARRDGKYSLLMPFAEYEPLVALCLQTGDEILADDGTRGNFQAPGLRAAFAFAASLYRKGYAARITHSEVTDLYSAFARGDYVFYITGPWNLGEFTHRLPANLQDSWSTALLPGPKGIGASSAGGASMCIARTSRNKDKAFRFIEHICAQRQQAGFYSATGDLPSDQTVWSQVGLMQDARSQAFYQQLNLARPVPPVPEWERIANEMVAALERIVRGLVSLDDALKGLDEFAFTALAKRRAMLERGRAA